MALMRESWPPSLMLSMPNEYDLRIISTLSILLIFLPIFQVLIDGPQSITGIHRQLMSVKRLSLTDIVVAKLPRNATQKNIVKAWKVNF
jgi:hypothetical protein